MKSILVTDETYEYLDECLGPDYIDHNSVIEAYFDKAEYDTGVIVRLHDQNELLREVLRQARRYRDVHGDNGHELWNALDKCCDIPLLEDER